MQRGVNILSAAKMAQIENAATTLEHQLNSAIIMFSFIQNVPAEEAMRFMITCLERKLASRKPILCGGIGFSESYDTLAPRLTGETVKTILVEQAAFQQGQMLQELGDSSDCESHKSFLGSEQPAKDENLQKRPPSRHSEVRDRSLSTRALTDRPVSVEKYEKLIAFKGHFRGCLESDYNKIAKNALEVPQLITGIANKRLVKLYSVSAGLHDRLHGSSVRPTSEFNMPKVLNATAEKVINDLFPMCSRDVPAATLAAFNAKILAKRTSEDLLALRKAGATEEDLQHGYELEEVNLYLRAGVNGRPDGLLRNTKGVVIGVVEFKELPDKDRDKKRTTALSQLSLYDYIFQPVESYLCYYGAGGFKTRVTIHRLEAKDIASRSLKIANMTQNYASIRKAIMAFNSKED